MKYFKLSICLTLLSFFSATQANNLYLEFGASFLTAGIYYNNYNKPNDLYAPDESQKNYASYIGAGYVFYQSLDQYFAVDLGLLLPANSIFKNIYNPTYQATVSQSAYMAGLKFAAKFDTISPYIGVGGAQVTQIFNCLGGDKDCIGQTSSGTLPFFKTGVDFYVAKNIYLGAQVILIIGENPASPIPAGSLASINSIGVALTYWIE